jgi:hypothetical protein
MLNYFRAVKTLPFLPRHFIYTTHEKVNIITGRHCLLMPKHGTGAAILTGLFFQS